MVDELRRFLGLDEAAALQAQRLWQLLRPHAAEIIEKFYRNLPGSQTEIFVSEEAISRLKQKQVSHWTELFNSSFGESYVRNASLVGIRHRLIGVDPKWYLAGYAALKRDFVHIIFDSPFDVEEKRALVAVLNDYVAIDMAIAISAYNDHLID